MRKLTAILAGLAVAALIEVGQAVTDNPFGPWGFDLSARDLSVKPGDDFFAYANGASTAASFPANQFDSTTTIGTATAAPASVNPTSKSVCG